MTISLNMLLTLITGYPFFPKEELELYFTVLDVLLSEKLDECEKKRISTEPYSYYSPEKTDLLRSYLLELYPVFVDIDKRIQEEQDLDKIKLLVEGYNERFPKEYFVEPIPVNYKTKQEYVKVKKK